MVASAVLARGARAFLRTDDALTAFAVSAFAAAREYDDAARVLASRARTCASLARAADAAPALVQRFLASKRAFDAPKGGGSGGSRDGRDGLGPHPGGVAAFASAAARRLAAETRARGARALAEDLR